MITDSDMAPCQAAAVYARHGPIGYCARHKEALAAAGGNRHKAARLLGMSRRNLLHWIPKLLPEVHARKRRDRE